MNVFWEHGYEATSTDDLLRAMGIGRQSMYDAFGDKHRLYLEALQLYETETGSELFGRVTRASSPFAALVRPCPLGRRGLAPRPVAGMLPRQCDDRAGSLGPGRRGDGPRQRFSMRRRIRRHPEGGEASRRGGSLGR